jgi:hypothetical protein
MVYSVYAECTMAFEVRQPGLNSQAHNEQAVSVDELLSLVHLGFLVGNSEGHSTCFRILGTTCLWAYGAT